MGVNERISRSGATIRIYDHADDRIGIKFSGIDTKIVILCLSPDTVGIVLIIVGTPFVHLAQHRLIGILHMIFIDDPGQPFIHIRAEIDVQHILAIRQHIVRTAADEDARALVRKLLDDA